MRYVIADKTWIKALTLLLFSALSLIARAELVATTVYYHNDLAGSPVALTDAAGALLWTVDRYPYGEEYQPDTASVDERIGYTGHVLDRGTGLVYMQARYYDPLVGRFYGIDPKALVAENAVSVNRYAYSGNNPYTYTDPNGEWLETGWDVLNVTIGLASLSANVATGNYLGATLDAVGLVYDVGAMAVPGVPAGASYVIKGARLGDEAVELGGSFVAKGGGKGADFIVSPKGTTMPTNKDFNLVDSKKKGGDWFQIHNKHNDAKVDGSPHTHYPKQHGGSRTREIMRTDGGDLDRADSALRNGSMRERKTVATRVADDDAICLSKNK